MATHGPGGRECRLTRCPAGIATPIRGRSTRCASRRRDSSCACRTTRTSSSSSPRREPASIHRGRCRSACPGRTTRARPGALERFFPSTGPRAARSPPRSGRCRSPSSRTGHPGHSGAARRGLRRSAQRVQRLVADDLRAGPRPRRRDARGRAAPRVRRARRARGADVGVDRQPGLPARLAAPRLRARGPATARAPRRADAAPALSADARGVAAATASTASRSTTSSRVCRFSALHDLASNLYNHAIMATPTTLAVQPRHRCRAR